MKTLILYDPRFQEVQKAGGLGFLLAKSEGQHVIDLTCGDDLVYRPNTFKKWWALRPWKKK